MQIQLSGPKALIAAAGRLAFGAYRIVAMQTGPRRRPFDELEMFLAAEYAGPEVAGPTENLASSTDAEARERFDFDENVRHLSKTEGFTTSHRCSASALTDGEDRARSSSCWTGSSWSFSACAPTTL